VDQAFTTDTEVAAERLYAVVADLTTYPNWMALVDRVEPDGSGGDGHPAWMVTLKARIGPLARAKRLRMVQTEADGHRVRFERRETDGRDHAAWVLTATVSEGPEQPVSPAAQATNSARSTVRVELHYGGSMWTGPLEAVLARAADDAGAELRAYAASVTDSAEADR
jgi:hypothetical protein